MTGTADLVGRRAELATVDTALRNGSALVLVIGEAGIGKTRLVTEAFRMARARGMLTVSSNCLPLTEKLPLLPITDLMQGLGRVGVGEVIGSVLDGLPAYVRAELGRLMPQLSMEPPAGGGPGEGWQRERLFTAVDAVLRESARRTPLAALIEDVHWADGATLDLLTYLRATTSTSPLSLVFTCRTDETPPSGTLVDWLAHLRRAGVSEVQLRPLTRDEIARQASALIGADAPRPFVDQLYARAEGNPFLTEQLVAAALMTSGKESPVLPQDLPGGLSELLVARIRRMGQDARAAIAAIAVAGRPLTTALIADVTGLGAEPVNRALRELAAAGVLARTARAFRPRHALLAEAVLADLLPDEQSNLHARVATALEATGDPALSAEVAGHWARTGRCRDELRATVVAAEVASGRLAFAEAADLWLRAIALSAEFPAVAETLDLDFARLHIHAIDNLKAAGRRIEAGTVAEAAYACLADWPDRQLAAIVHARTARFRLIRDPGSAGPLFKEALRLFEGTPPSVEHAETLRLYGVLLRTEGRGEDAISDLQEALRVAKAAGATAPQGRILASLAHAHFLRGELRPGFSALRRGRLLAREHDDVDSEMWLALFRSDALFKANRLHHCRRVALDGYERARRGGQGNTFIASIVLTNAVLALLEAGDVAGAHHLVLPVTAEDPRLDTWAVHLGRAQVDLCQGLMDEAARRLDRVRSLPLGGDVEFTREITQRVVEVALWRRATEGLLDTVACVLSRLTGTDQEPYCGELLVLGLRAAADLSHRGRARGDPAAVTRSLQGVDTLTAALDKMHGRPFANHPLLRRTAADKASWTAEWSRATGDNDPELWAAAAEQWETLQRPHRAAYAWWRCAEAFLYRTGYPSDAGKPLHSAAVASRGMAPLATEIRRMADRARITLARPATEEPPETTPAPLPALTRRELEVLRLVGAGRTNRQIGAELYMSPKTAAVHVTHILSKLGLANRAQAAAVAERAGLLDVEET